MTTNLSQTIGLVMTGARATCDIGAATLVDGHSALAAAAVKHLPLVVCVDDGTGASHLAYHATSETGVCQLFAYDAQSRVDLQCIAQRIAELALTPVVVAYDGEAVPPRNDAESVYLGAPGDMTPSPTPAQRLLYGEARRRVPAPWDVDAPMLSGAQYGNAIADAASAGQRLFFAAHLPALAAQAMHEFATRTQRRYDAITHHRLDKAEYVMVCQGRTIRTAEAVADHFAAHKCRVGVLGLTMLRPFPTEQIVNLLAGRQGILVLERVDQPLATHPPLLREIRTACYGQPAVPLFSTVCGIGAPTTAAEIIAAVENMLPSGAHKPLTYPSVTAMRATPLSPKQEIQQQAIIDGYPHLADVTLPANTSGGTPPIGITTEGASRTALQYRPGIDGAPIADFYRFSTQTTQPLQHGSREQPVDPFMASHAMPAATGLLRQRDTLPPAWIPEKCTGCGICWTVCPDSALPPIVTEYGALFEAVLGRLTEAGHTLEHLPKALRPLEQIMQQLVVGPFPDTLQRHLSAAIDQIIANSGPNANALANECALLKTVLDDFPLALTDNYYGNGQHGLLTIGVNPDRCQACMACVTECPEAAFVLPTNNTNATLRNNFGLWQALPTTGEQFYDTTPEGFPTLLLDKKAYHTMVGGDDAVPGSAHKTVLHLFAATVQASQRRHYHAHHARIAELLEQLQQHVQLRLAVNIADTQALAQVMQTIAGGPCTVTQLLTHLKRDGDPIDTEWLGRVTRLMSALQRLETLYDLEVENHRAGLGIIADRAMPWMARFPYHPFAVPWTWHQGGETTALARGLFEGHLQRVLDEVKVIRMATQELDRYNPKEHDPIFARMTWRDLTDEEFALIPPVVVVSQGRNDTPLLQPTACDIPIKVLLLDSFQLPAHAPLVAMTNVETFVMQGGMGDIPHLVDGFTQGLQAKRPALFQVFCSNVPEGRVVADTATAQARRAIATGSHRPLIYNPDRGDTFESRLSLGGLTPVEASDDDHGTTFADFVYGEGLFHDLFAAVDPQSIVPLVPLAEYLAMDAEEREEATPCIEGRLPRRSPAPPRNDTSAAEGMRKGSTRHDTSAAAGSTCHDTSAAADTPTPLVVTGPMVRMCDERRTFWETLQQLKRADIVPVDEASLKDGARAALLDTITASLVELASGDRQAREKVLSH